MTEPLATGPNAPLSFSPAADLEELLKIARSRYDLEFEQVSVGGTRLEIVQIANMRAVLDEVIAKNSLENALSTLPLWAKIWPSSVILGHVLSRISPTGHSLLEIGAGCGVTGIVAAALGFERVVISDINEDALLFSRINILKNKLQHRAEVRRIDIRTDMERERFSIIAGSEILYLEPLYRPLVKFLKRHLASTGTMPIPEVLFASDHRRNARPFFKRAEKEFRITQMQVGIKATNGAGDTSAKAERHLLSVYRLRHRA